MMKVGDNLEPCAASAGVGYGHENVPIVTAGLRFELNSEHWYE